MTKRINGQIITSPAGAEFSVKGVNEEDKTLSLIEISEDGKAKAAKVIKWSTAAAYTYKDTGRKVNQAVILSWLVNEVEKLVVGQLDEEVEQPVASQDDFTEPDLPELDNRLSRILVKAIEFDPFVVSEQEHPGQGRAYFNDLVTSQSRKTSVRMDISTGLKDLVEVGVLKLTTDGFYSLTPVGYRMLVELDNEGIQEDTEEVIEPSDTEDSIKESVDKPKKKRNKKSKMLDPNNTNLVYIPDLEEITGIEGRKLRRILRNMNLDKPAHTWVWEKDSEEFETLVRKLTIKGGKK